MGREGTQHKIDRVRRPRVHITYDVELEGAQEKKEIPFVVGVLADLSAEPAEPLPGLAEREFEEINRDNINQLMAKNKPRLEMHVPDKLTRGEGDPGVLNFELKFEKLADFLPENVARQVEPLRELLELRTKLAGLRTSMNANEKLERLLKEVIEDTERKRGRLPGGDQEVS